MACKQVYQPALLIALLVRARRRREDTRPYAVALTAFLGALAILIIVMLVLP